VLELHRNSFRVDQEINQAPPFGDRSLSLSGFLAIFRRNRWLVIGCLVLAWGIGATVYMTSPKLYTSKARMMLDATRSKFLSSQQASAPDGVLDAMTVESQVEVVRSEGVAIAVAKKLDLANDPDFTSPSGSPVATVIRFVVGLFTESSDPSESRVSRAAVDNLLENLTVTRVGLTYVIEISFRARDPKKAAVIANAFSDAYIAGQLEAKYSEAKRAADWLRERIAELRQESFVAESAVQDFKSQNNIVDTKQGLISEQQLGELNTQLVLVQGQVAEAKARLDRVNVVMTEGVTNAAVADTLKSEVINRMRQQYLDMQQQEAQLSRKYGREHGAAVNLRNVMTGLERSMADEVSRVAEANKSDYQIALLRQQAITANVNTLIKGEALTRKAQVTLRQLESTALSYRAIFDSFLQKYVQSNQQTSVPSTEARVITIATPPEKKSNPKGGIILGIASALGLMAGAAAAFGREALDRTFRSTESVESTLRVSCFGALPFVAGKKLRRSGPKILGLGEPKTDAPARDLDPGESIARYVINDPFSRFAETLRTIRVAADHAGLIGKSKVIGVVSAMPEEGATTIAANLAHLVAHAGNHVLLIDGGLRDAGLTRALAPTAATGLLDAIGRPEDTNEFFWQDGETGLKFLPAITQERPIHTAEKLSSVGMDLLLKKAKENFDYIIIDLPPLTKAVDARAISPLIEKFVFVVEWRKTSYDEVIGALSTAPMVYEKMLGVVLNKAAS
jgi:succinoglycan biosynthesis transport protein ExoP